MSRCLLTRLVTLLILVNRIISINYIKPYSFTSLSSFTAIIVSPTFGFHWYVIIDQNFLFCNIILIMITVVILMGIIIMMSIMIIHFIVAFITLTHFLLNLSETLLVLGRMRWRWVIFLALEHIRGLSLVKWLQLV